MTSEDSGGLSVDLKLLKQLIKKKGEKNKQNWLQIAINARREPGPGETLPASLASARLLGSAYRSEPVLFFRSSFF